MEWQYPIEQTVMQDVLVVGSGFFGATCARLLMDRGLSVLVVDKNEHVAGAAHDFVMDGVIVSSYGAHIFHSHNKEIVDFVQRFGAWEDFVNKPKVIAGNRVFSFPVNLMTLHQVWGVVTPKEAAEKLRSVQIPCHNPRNFEEWALSKIGRELYELFIYGYTKKQYHREPSELPASIIQRLPIRLTYDENYFTTCYQAVPVEGYTKIVERMLEGAEVNLCCDFFRLKDWRRLAKHLVYSGPIDRFYDYCYGKLDYNTLRFEHQKFTGDIQGNAVLNYADEKIPYLRSVEHQHFRSRLKYRKHHDLDLGDQTTIVSFDVPVRYSDHPEPYYPIRDERNMALYTQYAAIETSGVTFGGRLGAYSYIDLDQAVAMAMNKVKEIVG